MYMLVAISDFFDEALALLRYSLACKGLRMPFGSTIHVYCKI